MDEIINVSEARGKGRDGLKVDDALENKFPRARWKTKAEIVSGTRRVARCFFRLSFPPPYPPASLAQLGGINIVLVRASWKWKRWGWQLREFLFPIITALSCDSHSRGYCTAEVILWSLLTMPGLLEAGCTIYLASRRYPRRYLFIRKTDAISLYLREKRPRLFFIRETYVTSLYIFDSKRIRDEISKMKTKTVQRIAIFYIA